MKTGRRVFALLVLQRRISYVIMAMTKGKEDKTMNMQEASRIILGLRAVGWDDKSINDFILWVETGDERYKPAEKKEG
jgi:hypothetical protein